MKAEIERKFKAESLPPDILPKAEPGQPIQQGYLTVSECSETRVRKKGEKTFLTVKKGCGLSRMETEVEITLEQFDALWQATLGNRVEKVRHNFLLGPGKIAEIDIFSGENEGLILIEIEFNDESQASSFQAPDWFGVDVTGNPAYKNQHLAK